MNLSRIELSHKNMYRVRSLREFHVFHECVILTNIKGCSLTSHMHTARTNAYQMRVMHGGSSTINCHLL